MRTNARLLALLSGGLGPALLIAACTGEDATLSPTGADAATEQAPLAEAGAADTSTSDTSTPDGGDAAVPGCNKSAPFSTFTNVGDLNTTADELGLALSADELHAVVITYTSPAGTFGAQAWSRRTLSDPFVFVTNQVINEIDALYSVTLTADGLSLIYAHGGAGELVRTERASPAQPFNGKTIVAGPSAGSGAGRRDAFYSPALSGALFVTADVAGVTTIQQWTGPNFTNDLRVLEDVAAVSPGGVRNGVVSTTGTRLFYVEGSAGAAKIYSTTRVSVAAPFALGTVVTELAGDLDARPHFYSADECRLYFTSQARAGGKGTGKDIWVATRGN
jgi:hypothetical protein